jgi:hypothetical protein
VVSFPHVSLPKSCTHLSPPPSPDHLILLDLITRKIVGEQYRSRSSSLWSFLHSPVTTSFVGPNFLLSYIIKQYLYRYECFCDVISLNVSNLISSFYFYFIFLPTPPHVPYGPRGLPSRLWPKCNRLLRLGRPWDAVT